MPAPTDGWLYGGYRTDTEKLHITRAFLARKQKECEAIQREIEVLKKELGEDVKTAPREPVQPRKSGR
ncbi:hypothetical protein [Ectothiorhodospira shaposhnikovii]|uniref:hypothetical protein n=1 Tax=Ectothiorhodospira shaposhnikovii TaxID=1054 RepID=UPI0039A0DAB0